MRGSPAASATGARPGVARRPRNHHLGGLDDGDGILASTQLGTPASGVRGVYNVALDYGGGHQGEAVVAVYAISPYDGSHIHEVDVPVVLGY